MYTITYDGRKLISLDRESVNWMYKSPEDWMYAYASESGLDRELDYDIEALNVSDQFE